MPKLEVKTMVRLYGVSEKLDKWGKFQLVPFNGNAHNHNTVIRVDEIDEAIASLMKVLCGRNGEKICYEIDSDMSHEGIISIQIRNDERLEIQDITGRIDVIPERLYIIVNTVRKECKWVAAVRQGTLYEEIGLRYTGVPF
jgi:RNA-binding protein YhbY